MSGIQPSISDLIKKKRDGQELSPEELKLFVHRLSTGNVQDCQLGAMLMAMFIRGLTDNETVSLTTELIHSGQVLSWKPEWHNILVDKHSTGGVGDKVSIILVPALAACGLKVPMISGRGLEFTGGTLDKLESIPGFRINLSEEELESCLNNVGCFIAGTTQSLCPAEKEMYRTRDVTSTVDNVNLIVSSIISKKVASGIQNLVIDVKFGRATFCKTKEMATELAHQLVNVSVQHGVKARAVLSGMDSVLGYYVGNALEIAECVECLRGQGEKQLTNLVSVLGGNLLEMTNIAEDMNKAESMIMEVLANGKALKCFMSLLIQQGVNEVVANTLCYGNVWDILPRASHITHIKANKSGWIIDMNGLHIGRVCWELGAGRKQATDTVDYKVGIKLLKKIGEKIQKGEMWMELHHSTILESHILQILETSIVISSEYKENGCLIFKVIC